MRSRTSYSRTISPQFVSAYEGARQCSAVASGVEGYQFERDQRGHGDQLLA
jgi:hypothetical protein